MTRIAGTYFTEALPVLVLTGLGGLLAGLVFESMATLLESLPGLIVLVPAIIGLRGNINATLGSRLGSGVHMGVIVPSRFWKDKELVRHVNGSLVLSVIIPVIAGVAAWGTSRVLGLPSVPLWVLVGIAFVAGIVSGVILAAVTVLLVVTAFRYGLDPDNITGPGLAMIGDVVTILVLFLTASLFLGGVG